MRLILALAPIFLASMLCNAMLALRGCFGNPEQRLMLVSVFLALAPFFTLMTCNVTIALMGVIGNPN